MDNQLFRDIQTGLDLNGPILSFSTQPVGIETAGSVGLAATFIGIATVSFPGDSSAANSGTIAYQWYGPTGVLAEGTKYVGTATTTLTIVDVVSPADVGSYYVQADYIPSSETGNALNEPISSDSATITASPLLEINAQPSPVTTIAAQDRSFNIDASLTDNGTDLIYQWELDGDDVTDGNIQKSTLTPVVGTQEVIVNQGAVAGGSKSFNIPVGSKKVLIWAAGGTGGHGGGDFVVPNNPSLKCKGGRGGHGMEGIFTLGPKYYQFGANSEGYLPNINQIGDGSVSTTCAVTVTINVGRGGNDGTVSSSAAWAGGGFNAAMSSGAGGEGGAAGASAGTSASGNAGGGGGGGQATWVTISSSRFPTVRAVVAGAGGGCGGAWNQTRLIGSQQLVGSGRQGGDAGPARGPGHPNRGTFEPPNLDWLTVSGDTSVGMTVGGHGVSGHTGQNNDTPGGGGGGGGVNGGNGGHHGHQPGGAHGGGAGSSGYNNEHVLRWTGAYNQRYASQAIGNGYGSIQYTAGQQQVTTIQNVTRTTTISGSSTPELTLNTDGPGIGYTVTCSVSSPRASNSPVQSLEVGYQVESIVEEEDIIVEGIGLNLSTASVSQVNLANGELTLDTIGNGFVGTVPNIQLYSLYAPNKDVNVEMDLWGGGSPDGSSGEGGFARIVFQMKQDEEYVIAGLTDIINTPFVYRKGTLMACVGEGGKSGLIGAKGGNGGGVNMAGSDASGFNHQSGGSGGHAVGIGGLTLTGAYGSAFIAPFLYPGDQQRGNNHAGFTMSCTKGIYWSQQGVAPCADITGNTQFRLSDGTVVSNTGSITRGYKAGYNVIQTAGRGINAFRGGNGAIGGDGGSNHDSAGGGGSGYSDGSVTIVHTTQGGSTSGARVVIRKLDDSLLSRLPSNK